MKKLFVSLIAIGCVQFVLSSYAQVPGILNYQGRVSVGGTNFDGTGRFKFALVNNGASQTYWSNGVNTVSLTVTKGLYSVLLGDTGIANMTYVIPAAVFSNSDVRLRVWFGTSVPTIQQLSPDQRIGAVGYALVAGSLSSAGDVTGLRLNIGAGNVLGGNWSTIAGGTNNTASADYTTVGGGQQNQASAAYATVAGGQFNFAKGYSSVVAGGYFNRATNYLATVAGGYRNWATGPGSFIGGGGYDGELYGSNVASGAASVIGGGIYNSAGGMWATVGGGYQNIASADEACVGGGLNNRAVDVATVIAGGQDNYATNLFATVGGGHNNTASEHTATVGGGELNTASGGDAVVAGGNANLASGDDATVGGGYHNRASNRYATVGGGNDNTASGTGSFIGGGGYDGSFGSNVASGVVSVIGGGIYNVASGTNATVAGGSGNMATNSYATVPGGYKNTAGGQYSFAAGRRAKALADGSFVWADSKDFDFTSVTPNEFRVRCTGGAWFVTAINGSGAGTAGPSLNPGDPQWQSSCDRNLKENFQPVDLGAVLEKLARLPITEWNMKAQEPSIRHIGPMAQDFHAAFGLGGADDKHIGMLDADGVALAAIKGLYAVVKEQQEEIAQLKAQIAEMRGGQQ